MVDQGEHLRNAMREVGGVLFVRAEVALELQERIADLDERARLIEAFELSQSIYRKDPWAEHAKEAEKFAPLSDLRLEAAE